MYQNIVFDLGGVVIDYNPREFLLERYFNEKIETKLYDSVFGSNEWLLLDRGEISWEKAKSIFLQRGKAKDIAFEMQALMDDWMDMLTNRSATIALMHLMKKKGYSLYFLSNIAERAFRHVQDREFWHMFSGGIASYQVKSSKPDIEIYKALLNKYQLVPEETIFTDDNKPNTVAAFEAGMTGIHFTNVKDFVKELVAYGVDL